MNASLFRRLNGWSPPRGGVGALAGCLWAAQALFAAAADAPAARWIAVDAAVIEDTRTGLEWSRSDNGHDIDWQQAKEFCSRRAMKWRLPTIDELAAIYEGNGTLGASCGRNRCGVSGPFELSAEWFWSADSVGNDGSDGLELAWGFLMANGARTKSVQYAADGSRALCVRSATLPKPASLRPENATVSVPIDPGHTAVIFSWTHHGFSHPVARLEQLNGTLLWNRADLSQSAVEVNMPLEGLRTGDDGLNRRLRGSDFFDATRNPNITFKSTQIVARPGTNEFTLLGALTVRGTTKPVSLLAKINAIRDEPGKPLQMGFDADGVLRRSDFGLGRYVPMVSDEISIHISVEAHPD